MNTKRIIGIRTKTEYVNKSTEYRDYTPYWQTRLIDNAPTHFYKHNQHGLKSPIFKIASVDIVDSPQRYIFKGVLHTEKAIRVAGVRYRKDNPQLYRHSEPQKEIPKRK